MEQIFVGSKYEKFEKKVFSIPTFLFGGVYFAYRKMLIHAIIVSFVISLLDTLAMKFLDLGLIIITLLCIHISIGLYFPLWYKRFYKNKVRKILSDSSISEENKIKTLQKKGGTSIGFIIIFIIVNSILTGSVDKIINPETEKSNGIVIEDSSDTNNNSKTNSKKDSSNSTNNDSDYKIIEDADIMGYSSYDGKYQIDIEELGERIFYNCNADNPEVLTVAKNYDEISIKIYYTEDGETKTVQKYELYNKETNEKLENISNENDLRELLGYYLEGKYEEELTLIKIDDMMGGGYDDTGSFSSYNYIFKTDSEKEIEFEYKVYDNMEDKSDILEENQKYKVKFNVKKGTFGYENIITDINKL